ncbi:hypothetical protein N7481_001620 [Penicillium waksmanii]|uniref:uncharacterized protein n=1 Tax=Penicillium waksmanii TaxID=69791 RepID=UPI002546987E|nr:uncharacterized protein N7481_001620 [Penicillium waksmanii]KAJ6001211.1 hypothetical protein N7481_001620 [Penicillium waksmanii]
MEYLFPSSRRKHGRKKRWNLEQVTHYKDQSSRDDLTLPSAKLDILVESAPLICYGSPATSTGALFSGRLRITVTEPANRLIVRELDVKLVSKKTNKKPASSHCPNCTVLSEELTRWNLLSKPLLLESGYYDFPFSCLFPGHLPASCDSSLGQIEYILRVNTQSSTDEELNLELPLHVRRALIPSNDVSSTRTLPPTNLTCLVVRPSVTLPIGKFPVQMVLSGIVDEDNDSQTRWCLRRLMWRIEEHQRITSPACQKHAGKRHVGGKDILHQETRIVGQNEESNRWKAIPSIAGGEVNIQFDASISPIANATCDMDAHDGLEVKHDLVIEFVVAYESYSNRTIALITPTDSARLFSTRFELHVTEHSGLSISWDKELPPTYENVSARAPAYT